VRECGWRNSCDVDEAGRWTTDNPDYGADAEDYGENYGENDSEAAAYSGVLRG